MVLILDSMKDGPVSRFTDTDVFFTLDFLADGRIAGRQRIASYLGLGEGSARSLLAKMVEYDLVRIRQTGVTISTNGTRMLEALGMRAVDIDLPAFVLGSSQQGVVVRGASEKVFNGIAQRNAGIRAGGDGCTTWVMEDGRIIMLPKWDMDRSDPEVADGIRRATRMVDGDVLIVGGGSTPRIAKMAVATAALELV